LSCYLDHRLLSYFLFFLYAAGSGDAEFWRRYSLFQHDFRSTLGEQVESAGGTLDHSAHRLARRVEGVDVSKRLLGRFQSHLLVTFVHAAYVAKQGALGFVANLLWKLPRFARLRVKRDLNVVQVNHFGYLTDHDSRSVRRVDGDRLDEHFFDGIWY
jgi:hypothetical protein